jgi:hypothetical protein
VVGGQPENSEKTCGNDFELLRRQLAATGLFLDLFGITVAFV